MFAKQEVLVPFSFFFFFFFRDGISLSLPRLEYNGVISVQADLELPTSGDPPASTSQGAGIIVSCLSFSHPTSCSSSAEIMSVLFFYIMRYKQSDPENPDNDRFVLAKVCQWGAQGCCGACWLSLKWASFIILVLSLCLKALVF
uniref:Uncharacterized protein n=1 Tax=Piliocolobus tephrosceles TaxID=591936 RepID=A0A8C9HFI5_9PRIM